METKAKTDVQTQTSPPLDPELVLACVGENDKCKAKDILKNITWNDKGEVDNRREHVVNLMKRILPDSESEEEDYDVITLPEKKLWKRL